MLNLLLVLICALGPQAPAERNSTEEVAMAPIRRTVVEAEIEGQPVEVRITASGVFPVQQISSFDIWVGESKVYLPHEAYKDLDNPNPAWVDIRSPSGIVRDWVPPDVQRPIASIAIGGHGEDWVSLILLENLVPVIALARRDTGEECLSLQPRWDTFCERGERLRRHQESEAAEEDHDLSESDS